MNYAINAIAAALFFLILRMNVGNGFSSLVAKSVACVVLAVLLVVVKKLSEGGHGR